MHELAITQNILDIALRHADQAGADQITDLYLVIGQLSSVVDDSVQFYWELISQDTKAEGSNLHFERTKATMECQECHHPFSPGKDDFICPQCGGAQLRVTAGVEFYLQAIEVKIAEDQAGNDITKEEYSGATT